MKCPKCHFEDTKVIDTRETTESTIRRRRQCIQCEYRFTTLEEILREDIWIIKRDGRREKLNRGKILFGLEKAIEKRPISPHVIEQLLDELIEDLYSQHGTEVHSQEIGELIMQRLRAIDDIAYVRFASVYKDFRDVEEFAQAIQTLKSN